MIQNYNEIIISLTMICQQKATNQNEDIRQLHMIHY
jgi:hypothetical protein